MTRGRPEKRIPALAKAIGASSVHVSADYSPFGRRRDDAVRDALGDVPLEESGSPYLVSPGRVTKDDGTPYKVFTPFYAAWRKHGWRAPAASGAKSARWIDPKDVHGVWTFPTSASSWSCPQARRAARRQWKSFVQKGLDNYAEDRNRPDLPATSRMSAHLKFGTIHPRTMAADLGKGTGAQAYLRELAFRDFYAAVLHEWPDSAWWNWNKSFDKIEVDDDKELARCSTRGRPAAPDFRSSMRACASWPKPASCTTGCG